MVPEHIIDDGKKRMSNSDHSSFFPSSTGQAAVLGAEVGVFLPRCGPGCLSERGAEPFASFGSFSALSFAGALIAAGTDPGPRTEVVCGRELVHIATDLCYYVLSRAFFKARQTRHLLNRFRERVGNLLDSLAESVDLYVQIVKMIHQLVQHEPMVVSDMPVESKAKLWDFPPELSSGKLGHLIAILFAFN